MKLGIIGLGVTGSALKNGLLKRGHEVLGKDPKYNLNDDLTDCKAIFICVPVPTFEDSWAQDLRILKQVLKDHERLDRTPIFIRSTVLPKTTDHLRKIFRMNLFSMPEFLTERSKDNSFEMQGIICGALPDPQMMDEQERFLKRIFPDKTILVMANKECELAKYAHNAVGAVKVNFFNTIKKYADTIGAKFENVIDGVVMSGYVNRMHTQVPGPDGKYGFGGTCFPKDTAALIKELRRLNIQAGSLSCVMAENAIYRTSFDKDNFKQPEIKFDEKIKSVGLGTYGLTQ